ncbi:RimK family alpha-L-glutamate ligase [Pseudogracilibacillus sp. SE30717A]|uniref:ATP-grasp domain-containing protein n=1 Tax=Pseudogracilibacillus sp. SE30717A TaxID=3098293 RepID=UPI00300E1333
MNLTCWIIYNGFLKSNKFIDYAEMFQKAAIKRGHQAILYKNSDLLPLLTNELSILNNSHKTLPDYVVFTDKDIYLAKQLELLGLPVFNASRAIEISDDKILTYQYLSARKLPIPKTIISPKTYGLTIREDELFLNQVMNVFSFPFIIKEAFGSFGEQVYLVHNEEELKKVSENISNRPFVFQEFIESSYGKDIRVQVVGDKVVAAMIRTAQDDFRANVTSGGTMQPYQPTKLEQEVAIKATKAIGAGFAGVDLLFGKNNTPIICEINSNAHLRNLLDCTGINAADDIIHYIEQKLKEVTP